MTLYAIIFDKFILLFSEYNILLIDIKPKFICNILHLESIRLIISILEEFTMLISEKLIWLYFASIIRPVSNN